MTVPLLCHLVFCHCVKIPKISNLKGREVLFRLMSSEISIHGWLVLLLFSLWRGSALLWGAQFMEAKKRRERE
jgi:hypothetical protein